MENCYSLLVSVAQDQQTILHQTFTHHWLACRDRIHQFEPQSDRSADDILTVPAQLEQMMQLLQLELGAANNNGETRILDTILSDLVEPIMRFM